jgi:hypothetical protein
VIRRRLKRLLRRAGEELAMRLMSIEINSDDVGEVEVEVPPAPPPQDPLPDDAPFLGPDALAMLGRPPATPAPPTEPRPLEGSVEERMQRLRLR